MSSDMPGETREFYFSTKTGEKRLHVRTVRQGGSEDGGSWPLTTDGLSEAGVWATERGRTAYMPDGYQVTDPSALLTFAADYPA